MYLIQEEKRTKDISVMTREQIVDELRRFAHPQWYLSLLKKETAYLRALLSYYLEAEPGSLGIDFGRGNEVTEGKIIKLRMQD